MSAYSGKNVAVIGMARTGMAVAEVLRGLGANVTLYDRKPESELTDAVAQASRLGVSARVGSDEVNLNGADMVIPSPGVARSAPSLVEAVRRGVEIVSEIEVAYQLSPAPIVAVTGTNGKTTTTVLIGLMLRADGRDTFIAGNVVAGDIRMPLITATSRAKKDSVIVAEISSFQLEWIRTFKPKVAALLNIGSDHMDRYASLEEYAEAKANIFRNQQPDDFTVVNADHPFVMKLAGAAASKIVGFSRVRELDEGAFVRANEIIVRLGGRETRICRLDEIRVPGDFNVENILAASLAAMAIGARPEAIAEAIRAFRGVEHRLEVVAEIDGVEYINNSMCTNVDAVVNSIQAIKRPVVVIAGGKDKGTSDWAPFADVVKQRVKSLVLVGESAPVLEAAVRKTGYASITNASSMKEAVEAAREEAVSGDTILLAPGCASFDMFRGFEERGEVFKALVREYERRANAE